MCEVVDCANASISMPPGRAGQGPTKYRVNCHGSAKSFKQNVEMSDGVAS